MNAVIYNARINETSFCDSTALPARRELSAPFTSALRVKQHEALRSSLLAGYVITIDHSSSPCLSIAPDTTFFGITELEDAVRHAARHALLGECHHLWWVLKTHDQRVFYSDSVTLTENVDIPRTLQERWQPVLDARLHHTPSGLRATAQLALALAHNLILEREAYIRTPASPLMSDSPRTSEASLVSRIHTLNDAGTTYPTTTVTLFGGARHAR
jgi:hypothetical protein